MVFDAQAHSGGQVEHRKTRFHGLMFPVAFLLFFGGVFMRFVAPLPPLKRSGSVDGVCDGLELPCSLKGYHNRNKNISHVYVTCRSILCSSHCFPDPALSPVWWRCGTRTESYGLESFPSMAGSVRRSSLAAIWQIAVA